MQRLSNNRFKSGGCAIQWVTPSGCSDQKSEARDQRSEIREIIVASQKSAFPVAPLTTTNRRKRQNWPPPQLSSASLRSCGDVLANTNSPCIALIHTNKGRHPRRHRGCSRKSIPRRAQYHGAR